MGNRQLANLRRRLGIAIAACRRVPSVSVEEGKVLMRHALERRRHDPRRRMLTVRQVDRLSPGMLRIALHGDDLADFATHAPDDHVKLLFPMADGEVARRDYTPRRFDRDERTLTIDFALHESGPATDWAVGAAVGDPIGIAGPKMSVVIPQDYDWWLLIGDEASLPAISRRLEEMRAGTPVTALITVTGPDEERPLETQATLDLAWIHRPLAAAHDAGPTIEKLRSLPILPGEGFVWIGGEGNWARALRREIVERRGQPREWVKARGYWRMGEAGSHDKIED